MSQNHKSRPTNVSSMLLNPSENDSLFQVIGRGCVTLATGVVQLYLAEPPDRNRWSKRSCGVACFVKDNPKRSYFIRVFDIKKGQMIWEQEIYNQFRYKTPREYFHTFEAHTCAAGLNFASEDEADKFQKAVEGKLQERQNRRREKKRQPSQTGVSEPPPLASRPPNQAPPQANVMMQPPATNLEVSSKHGSTNTLSKKDKKKDKSKKLTKADIGAPTEFRHVSHVGWDPNKGFDMNNLEPDMQTLFQSVGISATDQLDKETVDFIYDFVEKHGGMDAVRQEIKRAPPPAPSGARPGPPPPQRTLGAPPPPSRGAVPPPPPPSRGPSNSRGGAPPPPPPNRGPARAPNTAPPPPPPSTPKAAPPPLPPTGRSMLPPPPPSTGASPPPPPPPAPGPPPPPPPPPPGPVMDMGGGSSGEGRGALLAAIQAGTKLKSVDSSEPVSRSTDSRGQLLDAIRQGAKLRQVDLSAEKQAITDTTEKEGLVGALARALASRNQQIHGGDEDESSEDDEEEEDDDEWDD